MIALLFSLALAVQHAEQWEYGSPAEMRGLTKYFVDTGAQKDVHDNIVARISAALPKLRLVDHEEDAELIIVFGAGTHSYITTDVNGHVAEGSTSVGDGVVFKVAEGSRLRLLYDDHPTREWFFERRASSKFADGFIKAYKKANNLK